MRALIVSHAAIRASNRRVYRALAQRGAEVTLVIPSTWKSGLGAIRAEDEPSDSPLRVHVLRRRGLSHSNVYWLDGLARVARACNPDVIYVDEDPAGIVAAQAAQSARTNNAGLVVLGIQNLVKQYPPPFGLLQQYVFRNAQTAVFTSRQAARALRVRGFGGPMHMMPFTTDLTPLSPLERERVRGAYSLPSPLVGFVGRLVPEKGVDVLLRAVAQISGLNAVVVGDGPQRAELENLSQQLSLTNRVRFLGAKPPEEAARLVGCLDVLALPSRTRTNWSEQFGRIIIEAMARGVAVVASDSGAIGEVVGDAGVLVPEGDPELLAAAIRAAVAPLENRRLRISGLERVAAHYRCAVEVSALHDALTDAVTLGAIA